MKSSHGFTIVFLSLTLVGAIILVATSASDWSDGMAQSMLCLLTLAWGASLAGILFDNEGSNTHSHTAAAMYYQQRAEAATLEAEAELDRQYDEYMASIAEELEREQVLASL